MKQKTALWLDLAFVAVGVVTLLLFMPGEYADYRLVGYIGAGIFVIYLVWREMRRKRMKREAGEQ